MEIMIRSTDKTTDISTQQIQTKWVFLQAFSLTYVEVDYSQAQVKKKKEAPTQNQHFQFVEVILARNPK